MERRIIRHQNGSVPCPFECFGQSGNPLPEPVLQPQDVVTLGIERSKERSGRSQGVGSYRECICKDQTFLAEPVDLRSGRERVSIATHVVGSGRVKDHNEDIRGLSDRGRSIASPPAKQEKEDGNAQQEQYESPFLTFHSRSSSLVTVISQWSLVNGQWSSVKCGTGILSVDLSSRHGLEARVTLLWKWQWK